MKELKNKIIKILASIETIHLLMLFILAMSVIIIYSGENMSAVDAVLYIGFVMIIIDILNTINLFRKQLLRNYDILSQLTHIALYILQQKNENEKGKLH